VPRFTQYLWPNSGGLGSMFIACHLHRGRKQNHIYIYYIYILSRPLYIYAIPLLRLLLLLYSLLRRIYIYTILLYVMWFFFSLDTIVFSESTYMFEMFSLLAKKPLLKFMYIIIRQRLYIYIMVAFWARRPQRDDMYNIQVHPIFSIVHTLRHKYLIFFFTIVHLKYIRLIYIPTRKQFFTNNLSILFSYIIIVTYMFAISYRKYNIVITIEWYNFRPLFYVWSTPAPKLLCFSVQDFPRIDLRVVYVNYIHTDFDLSR